MDKPVATGGRTSLTQYYNDLKSQVDSSDAPNNAPLTNVGGPTSGPNHPGAMIWKRKCAAAGDCLRDKFHKRILVDIYCKILPLDQEYIDGHHGQMVSDVDAMLADKGMSGTEYLRSCYEATNAPLLEFILRAGDTAYRTYMEEANKTLEDAQKQNMKLPDPDPDPDPEDEPEVAAQLVDVQKDTEYDSFIDKLKEKTVNKIVSDVSKLISDKKEEKQMTFDTKSPAEKEAAMESVVSIGLNYLQKEFFTEAAGGMTLEAEDMMMGMAIREACLNQFDVVFNNPQSDVRGFSRRIRSGGGHVICESGIKAFREQVFHS